MKGLQQWPAPLCCWSCLLFDSFDGHIVSLSCRYQKFREKGQAQGTGTRIMKKRILDRYARTPDNKIIIDIAVDKVEDLYSDFDKHTPYRKKDLDPDFADYLVECVHEFGREDFVIQFRFAATIDMSRASRVEKSIHNYFLYLKELELRELAKMARTSLILLAIGVAILFLSVWLSQKITGHENVITRVFTEGLTVAAWVSLWNALATFLIHWTPHHKQIKRYERIANAPILFHSGHGNVVESTTDP